MGRILLIRHAESTWNAEGRMQGWADPPLSDSGARHARALGLDLARGGAGQPVVAAVSSGLRRAAETAAAVSEACGCPPPQVDARLREREVGWLTGLTDAEARLRWPEEVAGWREGQRDRPPGGESAESVLGRARAALDAAAPTARSLDGVLLAVSHGGLISALERDAGLGPGGFRNLSGRWVLVDGQGWRMGNRFVPGEVDGSEVDLRSD